MVHHHDDPVTTFIADYLDAIEAGAEPPPLDRLEPTLRREANELLNGINTDPSFEFEPPPAAPDAAERCRTGAYRRDVARSAADPDPTGRYCADVNTSVVGHLHGDALDARLRHIASRCPQPYPVLLYHRIDEGADPPLWMASVDQAHDWFYFASEDTRAEAIDGRLDVLVSGVADAVTADDWIADDGGPDERLDPEDRADVLTEHQARTADADADTGLAVASFAVHTGFEADSLWMHQHRAETELRALRRHIKTASEALARRQRRPEQLDVLVGVLETATRSCVSPMEDAARTVGWTDAISASDLEAAGWRLREALLPFGGRLLASGCDGEQVVAAACSAQAAKLQRALDAWLMSASLRRIAARGTIFESRALLPDTYREAVADVEAYISHPEVQGCRSVARRGERLLVCLRSVAAGGEAKRAERAAERFLRSASRRFGTV